MNRAGMLSTDHTRILVAAFLPYLALAAYDGWLHEKARRVPRPEQVLHGLIALGVVGVCIGIFGDRGTLAWSALAVFALAGGADELGFHAPLPTRERRLHHAAYACFAGFIGVALALGALPLPRP
jgi:hypothetical protein